MKAVLNHLFEHKTLSKDESKEILKNIASGKYQSRTNCLFSYCIYHEKHYRR